MDSRKGYRAGAILALFLVLIAASFSGKVEALAISSECTDGLDNDGDSGSMYGGGIDVDDAACFSYPFNDGNGEEVTPINERYTSIREYPSLFEYHRDYGTWQSVCNGYGGGYYDQFPEQKAEADSWLDANNPGINRNMVGCPP